MNKRLLSFSQRMDEAGVYAALLTSPENVRYLTGFTGEGALLVCAGQAAIITDFRYVEQAARESPDCSCLRTLYTRALPAVLADELKRLNAKAVSIETGFVTVAEQRALAQALEGVEMNDLPPIAGDMRMVKDDYEISCIVRASEIACAAFERLLGILKPGMTEKDVQLELDYLMLRGGSEALAFNTIACSGINGALPHAKPSAHKLCAGELLTLDFGAQVNGYKTDMTRTVAIGSVSQELKAIYDTVLHAQMSALEAIEPGVMCGDVDKIARDITQREYPGAFGHSLGHGVGLCIHEQPSLRTGCETVLEPGHVVTVEPGVYVVGVGGCRIEDTVILRPGGYVNVITAPKELITI